MKIGNLQILLIHYHTVQDPVSNLSPYHTPVLRGKYQLLLATNHMECSFYASNLSPFHFYVNLINSTMGMGFEHHRHCTRSASLHAQLSNRPQLYYNLKSREVPNFRLNYILPNYPVAYGIGSTNQTISTHILIILKILKISFFIGTKKNIMVTVHT